MDTTIILHQKAYEKLLYKLRRHPITFMPTILLFLVLILLPIGLAFILQTQMANWLAKPAVFTALVLLGSAYYLGMLIFFYSNFIDFYLDILFVTNDRLVDMEQNGLFARTISEVDLYQIQDITSEVKGVFASMFNFGKITIQTAGSLPKFIVRDVPNPHHIRQIILDLVEEDRKYHTGIGVNP